MTRWGSASPAVMSRGRAGRRGLGRKLTGIGWQLLAAGVRGAHTAASRPPTFIGIPWHILVLHRANVLINTPVRGVWDARTAT
jgi:hypothetical protein